jgi:arylsulfatase A-like enzyme
MDVMPTVAELCGVPLEPDDERQGMSLAGRMAGGEGGREHTLAETFAYGGEESGAGSHLDFAGFSEQGGSANLSLRTDTERYVFRWNDEDELFDLAADPHEIVNLAGARAERDRVEGLRRALVAEIERTDARFGAAVRGRMAGKAAGAV